MMIVSHLQSDEYPSFYEGYISQVSAEHTLSEELEISVHKLIKFVQNIPLEKLDYRYAQDKWTIKDILQHLIDSERIFAYRALVIARNDKTELASFDENKYAYEANANDRGIKDLLTELAVVRQATLTLFKSFTTEQLMQRGFVFGNMVSVRAFGFVIIGHQNHHMKIFAERYLK